MQCLCPTLRLITSASHCERRTYSRSERLSGLPMEFEVLIWRDRLEVCLNLFTKRTSQPILERGSSPFRTHTQQVLCFQPRQKHTRTSPVLSAKYTSRFWSCGPSRTARKLWLVSLQSQSPVGTPGMLPCFPSQTVCDPRGARPSYFPLYGRSLPSKRVETCRNPLDCSGALLNALLGLVPNLEGIES